MEVPFNTFLETPRPNVIQTASHCCFEKFRIKLYSNRPSLDYPLDLTENRPITKNGHKIKKRANSDDLLGNMQLKLSFDDWCISILSSKKCQTSIILADLLEKESFLQRVQKVIVYGCDWWISIRFLSFCVSRFVACDIWQKPDVNIPNTFDRFHPWTSDFQISMRQKYWRFRLTFEIVKVR